MIKHNSKIAIQDLEVIIPSNKKYEDVKVQTATNKSQPKCQQTP